MKINYKAVVLVLLLTWSGGGMASPRQHHPQWDDHSWWAEASPASSEWRGWQEGGWQEGDRWQERAVGDEQWQGSDEQWVHVDPDEVKALHRPQGPSSRERRRSRSAARKLAAARQDSDTGSDSEGSTATGGGHTPVLGNLALTAEERAKLIETLSALRGHPNTEDLTAQECKKLRRKLKKLRISATTKAKAKAKAMPKAAEMPSATPPPPETVVTIVERPTGAEGEPGGTESSKAVGQGVGQRQREAYPLWRVVHSHRCRL